MNDDVRRAISNGDQHMTAAGKRQPIGEALRDTGVVAILRGARGERLEAVCDTLLAAGVRCLEITTNTPSGFDAVRRLAGGAGGAGGSGVDVEVGVGTVRTLEQ